MPRISEDEILKCAVYLYKSQGDARAGKATGGSGFLLGVPYTIGGQSQHVYAVTAAHVIEDGFTMVRLNTRDGRTHTITYGKGNWVRHPIGDDVAVALMDLGSGDFVFEYIHGRPDLLITKQLEKTIALGAGDDVFMIGRFMGREERHSNVPIVRFGHISGPQEELIDQRPGREFTQESFLVEIHSISGFSGSPVFVSIPQERLPHDLRDPYNFPTQTYLLGVDWGHLDETNFPGMAGVVPAWKLLDLLNTDEVLEVRKEREKKLASKRHARLDARQPETQQTLVKNKQDRIDIPVPTKDQFDSDLAKVIRKRGK